MGRTRVVEGYLHYGTRVVRSLRIEAGSTVNIDVNRGKLFGNSFNGVITTTYPRYKCIRACVGSAKGLGGDGRRWWVGGPGVFRGTTLIGFLVILISVMISCFIACFTFGSRGV